MVDKRAEMVLTYSELKELAEVFYNGHINVSIFRPIRNKPVPWLDLL